MIETRVSDDFMIDGVAVWISCKEDGGSRLILRLSPDGYATGWDPAEPLSDIAPTFRLTDESARSLLNALLRHYEGASDMRTVRGDLLHERGRVDKMLAVLSELAARPQVIQLRKAEQ